MLDHATASSSPFSKTGSHRWMAVAIAAMLSVSGIIAYTLWRLQVSQPAATQMATAAPKITTVTAMGRLEPRGEVIKLSAPTANKGNRVDQLRVKEGDRVQAGDVIAILDNRDRLQAALEQAQEEVRVAQAKLAITEAGAKQGEIAAQRAEITRLQAQRQGDIDAQAATVARLEAELQNARTEYNRYQTLYQNGAISASGRDSKRLTLETAKKTLQEGRVVLNRIRVTSPAELNQAKATLERIAEVRSVDVAADRVGVARYIAAMKQAKAELEQAYVRSPIHGEILYVHTRSGEVVSNDGIVEIGQTRQMDAVAEVYQSDINKVHLGQRVRVTSDSIPGELYGMVERVGSQVRRQTIINTDPSTNIDARVVEVHVALDQTSTHKAAKFTNLQVKVVIEQ